MLPIVSSERDTRATPVEVVRRVRCEYLEMPGLRLTLPQASRLLGLDSTTCKEVLEALVESRFLTRALDGRYGRYVT